MNNYKIYLIVACILVIIVCVLLLFLRYKNWKRFQTFKKNFDDKYLEVWSEKLRKNIKEHDTTKKSIISELKKFDANNKENRKYMSKKVLKNIMYLTDLAENDNKDLIEISNKLIEKWTYKDFKDYAIHRFTIVEIQTYMEILIDLQNKGH